MLVSVAEYEDPGFSLLEAAFLKKKIITSLVDNGPKDMKKNGDLCYFFNFNDEKSFLAKIMSKEKRTDEDFSKTLGLISKYKAVETTFKKAEYFVNISYDALAIFPETEDKKILQNLTSFSLNRTY